jgi:hypothetical protein
MDRILVGELRGVGNVYQGESLLMEAPYAIDVYRELIGGIPGLIEVLGRLQAPSRIFSLLGKPLTLELDDTRRFDFCFETADGGIVYMGGMRGADGEPCEIA